MIRAYKKKEITVQDLDYQKLLIEILKEKYVPLFFGLLASFVISTFTYKIFLKNIRANYAFKLPGFNFLNKKEVEIKKTKPVKTYTVAEGDDLWNIAEKFYGSGFNAYDISNVNKISDSSSLEIGMKLIIPDVKPRMPTVGEISATSTSQVTFIEDKYIVQPGDSLSLIAEKVYGDMFAYERIMNANNMTLADSISAGMVLIIPR